MSMPGVRYCTWPSNDCRIKQHAGPLCYPVLLKFFIGMNLQSGKLKSVQSKDSLLVILHHGKDHASIGFIGNGQSAYVMVSINDTALTMNESFQNTQKFAARIADFFIDAPKSGHKAIQHMLSALSAITA
ncbi:hypothetical protein D3C84_896100 [compost metagenome]